MTISTSIRLDGALVSKANTFGEAQSRTAPKQIEYWAKIGIIMEENPDLTYEFVKQALIAKAEMEAGEVSDYEFD